MLLSEKIPYTKIELNSEIKEMLATLTQENADDITVPKIMIGGKLIRSRDEFFQLKATSALAYLSEASGAVANTTR